MVVNVHIKMLSGTGSSFRSELTATNPFNKSQFALIATGLAKAVKSRRSAEIQLKSLQEHTKRMHAFDSFKCPLENCTSPGVHQIFGTANELLAHIIQYHILQLVYIEPQECFNQDFELQKVKL